MGYLGQTVVNERVLLEKVRLAVARRITNTELLKNVRISQMIDRATGEMVLHLETCLSGCRLLREEHSVQVPASWWQHLKDTYFPIWAKRRWPTITRSIKVLTVTQYLLLPDVPVDAQSEKYHVKVAQSWSEAMNRW